jgi:hypothetical protein
VISPRNGILTLLSLPIAASVRSGR